MISEERAKGKKGFLLKNLSGEYFFRVYNEDEDRTYTDYDLVAHDIEIEIIDNYTALYKRDDDNNILDYTSRVLGKDYNKKVLGKNENSV